ncbi:MAG: hypothetical protein ABFD46_01810 [Armatimonadota bacterium]
MSIQSTDEYRSARPLLLIVLAIVFAGFVLYSTLFVKHEVSKSSKTELSVTELSLTHDVIRGKDGKLEAPAEKPSISPNKQKAGKSKSGGKACPT